GKPGAPAQLERSHRDFRDRLEREIDADADGCPDGDGHRADRAGEEDRLEERLLEPIAEEDLALLPVVLGKRVRAAIRLRRVDRRARARLGNDERLALERVSEGFAERAAGAVDREVLLPMKREASVESGGEVVLEARDRNVDGRVVERQGNLFRCAERKTFARVLRRLDLEVVRAVLLIPVSRPVASIEDGRMVPHAERAEVTPRIRRRDRRALVVSWPEVELAGPGHEVDRTEPFA